jgi:hypothetical protein
MDSCQSCRPGQEALEELEFVAVQRGIGDHGGLEEDDQLRFADRLVTVAEDVRGGRRQPAEAWNGVPVAPDVVLHEAAENDGLAAADLQHGFHFPDLDLRNQVLHLLPAVSDSICGLFQRWFGSGTKLCMRDIVGLTVRLTVLIP